MQCLTTLAYPGLDLQLTTDAFLKVLGNQKVAYEVMNRGPCSLADAQKCVETHEHEQFAALTDQVKTLLHIVGGLQLNISSLHMQSTNTLEKLSLLLERGSKTIIRYSSAECTSSHQAQTVQLVHVLNAETQTPQDGLHEIAEPNSCT